MMKFLRKLTATRCLFGALLVLLCVSVAMPAQAAKQEKTKTKIAKSQHKKKRPAPVPSSNPDTYADIVIEADTGRVLHETNGSARRHPASLTKMMTLYLTFQAIENSDLRLETLLPVSSLAANQAPSKLGLRAGQTIRVYDAIMGLVTQSANDAAVVLAEGIGGDVDQFAKMMVDQARTLGMRGTFFCNPNGLPNDQQVTTARDMAVLGQALVYHYPGFYTYFGRQSFVYKGRAYHNHNHLMERYVGMDGIKTGYIRASGFNLVASVVRNNKRLIAVIFGGRSAASRDNDMAKLLDRAFEELQNGNETMATALSLPSKVPSALALADRSHHKPTTPPAQMPLPPRPNAPNVSEAPPSSHKKTDVALEQTTGGWGIQVGAFSSIDAAQQYLTSIARILTPLLGQAEQSLQKVTMTDGTEIYRTRFMGIEQKTARDACTYMVKHGQSCLVVSEP